MNIVYAIRCTASGKLYIGSTTKAKNRKAEHIRALRAGGHHSIKLQRAWNKYGEDSFCFETVESDIPYELLLDREQFWIDSYESFENGYNSRESATPCLFGELNGMFGKPSVNKGIPSKNRRPIACYDINTGEVRTFEYTQQVIDTGFAKGPQFISCISYEKIIKNRFCSLNGYFWFYAEDLCIEELKKRFEFKNKPNPLLGKKRPIEHRIAISKSRMGMKFSENHRKNMSLCKIGIGIKKVIRSDGATFQSIKEAAKETGCDRTSISHCLSGKNKTCNGYGFSYADIDSLIST